MTRTGIVLSLLLIAACGQEPAVDDTETAAAESAAATAGSAEAESAAAPPTLGRRPAPDGAVAYIISPTDGALVSSPVRVVFGLSGAGVVPAGIERADAGHHHLLIDADMPDLDQSIPSDANHLHFGGGQTETEIELEPGTHTLRLLLGDHLHVPHDPPIMSEPVTIEVQ